MKKGRTYVMLFATIVFVLSNFLSYPSGMQANNEDIIEGIPEALIHMENEEIMEGYFTDLDAYVDALKTLNEGTIISTFQYKGSSESDVHSLFSLSNDEADDHHFHLYVMGDRLGSENRNEGNVHVYKDGVNLLDGEEHTIAMVVDQEEGYTYYVDGEKVHTDTSSDVSFLRNISEANKAELGRTKRTEGQNEYHFEGDIQLFELYEEVLSEEEVLALTGGALPEAPESPEGDMVTWIPTGNLATSAFERVNRQAPDTIPTDDGEHVLEAVKNGHVSTQVAITSDTDLENVEVEVSDLESDQAVIDKEHISAHYPSYIKNAEEGGVIADPLEEADRIDIPANEVQPAWFTLAIPQDAASGSYQGEITITADGQEAVVYPYTVEVANVSIPNPEDFEFHLNLWMQPDTVAVNHGVDRWSDAHWNLLEGYIQDIASRGQKVINAAVADDPWRIPRNDGSSTSQTATPFESLVDWSYDGENWSFDYDKFDQYVQLSLDNGMGPYIHAFGMVMFNGQDHLKYTDTRTNEVKDEVVELGGELWTDAWSAFLHDFEEHLTEKGWLEQTLLGFDERPVGVMQTAFDLLDDVSPTFSNKLAIAADSDGLEPYAHEISFNYSVTGIESQELIDERREADKITTFYTYYMPNHPNTTTNSPLVGARTLPWIASQNGLDGYLRWTYNSWPLDVMEEPKFEYLQGDEYIVYPGEDGPLSSVRWEMFRNGVEDFELIEQLRNKVGTNNAALQKALALVDADESPSKESYEDVLAARHMVIQELAKIGDVTVESSTNTKEVAAGDTLELTTTITNDGDTAIENVEVDVETPEGWRVTEVEKAEDNLALANDTYTKTFEISVPYSEQKAKEVDVIANISFERNGEVIETNAKHAIKVTDLRTIPQSEMTARATSEEKGEDEAANAIDGNENSLWHTDWSGDDVLPQSITLDLGNEYLIDEFSYLPRQSGINGIITKYALQVSTDGENFTEVASGDWANDAAEERVTFDPQTARYVKLEAKEGTGGYASAAELNVFQVIDLAEVLQDLLEKANALDEGAYTSESFANLQVAMTEAEDALQGDDGEALGKAIDGLYYALNDLEEADEVEPDPEEVDRQALEAAIADAKEKTEADYTKESWTAFATALAAAETVLADEDATQDEVDEAVRNLVEADKALVEKEEPTDPEEVDKSNLEEVIKAAKQADEEAYTVESWQPFAAALKAAEAVLADEDATQDEVDAAITALEKAQEQLEEAEATDPSDPADKDALEKIIKEANKKAEKDYTAASWKAFAQALTAAEEIMADEDASDKEVQAALAALEDAMKALETVKEEPSNDEENDDEQDVIVDETDEEEGSALPSTATDMFNWMVVGMILLLTGLGVWMLGRRKRA